MRGILLIVIAAMLPVMPAAQETAPPTPPAFFSGTVVTATAAKVTVMRKGVKNDITTKTFAIDPSTKIEGALKAKVHATVEFVTDENGGDRALRIVVRVVR